PALLVSADTPSALSTARMSACLVSNVAFEPSYMSTRAIGHRSRIAFNAGGGSRGHRPSRSNGHVSLLSSAVTAHTSLLRRITHSVTGRSGRTASGCRLRHHDSAHADCSLYLRAGLYFVLSYAARW